MVYRWYEEFPERYEKELSLLKSSGVFEFKSESKVNGAIKIDGMLKVEDGWIEEIEISLDNSYPNSYPAIVTKNPVYLKGKHCNPQNGVICRQFTELEPWDSLTDTVENYLQKKVREWFKEAKNNFSSKDIVDVPEPPDYDLFYSHLEPPEDSRFSYRVILIPDPLTCIPSYFKRGRLTLLYNKYKRSLIVSEIHDNSNNHFLSLGDFDITFHNNLEIPLDKITGYWIKADKIPPKTNKKEELVEYLVETLKVYGVSVQDIGAEIKSGKGLILGVNYLYRDDPLWLFFLIVFENPPVLKFGNNTKTVKGGKPEDVYIIRSYPLRIESDIFKRLNYAINYQELSKSTVLIAGLGALGSEVAINLVSSGVQNFILFDNDRTTPGNVIRHICDLTDIGQYKVESMKKYILQRNPNAKVSIFTEMITEKPDLFIKEIENSNLVVGATGSKNIARFMNYILLNKVPRPAVYGWVKGGAISGEVFKVIPKNSPCVECLVGYSENLGINTKLPELEINNKKLLFPSGCSYPAFPGAGIDIKTVAIQMARLSIETLLNTTNGYDHFYWTNQLVEGCNIPPLHWIPKKYKRYEKCHICGG